MVREVAQILQTASLGEIELEESQNRLTLRRAMPPIVVAPHNAGAPASTEMEPGSSAGAPATDVAPASSSSSSAGSTNSAPGAASASGAASATTPATSGPIQVVAPCVGVFRTAREPLEVGARVKRKQILGSVEALNVPNEIYAPGVGTLVAWHVQDGQGVEWGQLLLELEPAREEDLP